MRKVVNINDYNYLVNMKMRGAIKKKMDELLAEKNSLENKLDFKKSLME